MYLFVLQLSHMVPHRNCVMFLLFQDLVNGVVEVVCLFI